MKIKIDYHSGKPVYRQIMEKFIEAIGRGEFATDTPIPSVRELAQKLSINPNTVARAYRELEREGYIYSRPGIGMFVKVSKEKIEEIVLERAKDKIRKELNSIVAHGITRDKCKKILLEILKEFE